MQVSYSEQPAAPVDSVKASSAEDAKVEEEAEVKQEV